MKIVLIRHTSVNVAPGICYGQTDVPLSDTFPIEAAEVASRLAGYTFDRVYSSPLSRCKRLAEFCGYSRYITDPRLLEINFGKWEMQRFDDITDPRLQEWYDDYINVAPTGGESFLEQQARFIDFLNEIKLSTAKCVALFTHCGIIAQALVTLHGKTPAEVFAATPPYGTVLEIDLI